MPSHPLLAPEDVNEAVPGDGIKPRRERSAAVERVSCMMHRDERFLDDVIDPGHRRSDTQPDVAPRGCRQQNEQLGIRLLFALPGALWRRWRGAGPREAVDVGVIALVCIIAGGSLAGAGMRYRVLTRMAGDHAAMVLREAFTTDVPHRLPVPPRVLVADPDRPKWLLLRERGGAEIAWFAEKLDGVGPAVRSQDGLLEQLNRHVTPSGGDAPGQSDLPPSTTRP
jgi:hypothetical protein